MKGLCKNTKICLMMCLLTAMLLIMAGCGCGQRNNGESSAAETTSHGAGMQESSSQEIGTSSSDGVNQVTEPEYGTGHESIAHESTSHETSAHHGTGADTVGGSTTDPIYKPGTYTGSAQGYGGRIKVTVEVDEKHILSIEAVGADETPTVGQKAIEELSQRIKEANGTDIEGVSGATYSSQGLFEAVKDALEQAYTGE